MKKDIHPKYYNAKVTCSCGNTFFVGSTVEEIQTELCSKCHPFYTGAQKIVDTENLVAKFEKRQKKTESLGSFRTKKDKIAKRKEKYVSQKGEQKALTLKDMLANLSK